VSSGDWVDGARHKAADAAEAVADVIRPPERDPRVQDAEEVDSSSEHPVEEEEPALEPEVEPGEPPKPGKPRKRSL
jgi:hypothetical protein